MSAAKSAIDYRRRFKITHAQSLILELLATGEVIPLRQIASSGNTAATQIYRLRKAVAPIEIRNLRSDGYCIDEPHLSALRRLV